MGVSVVLGPDGRLNVLRSQGLAQGSVSDEVADFGSVVKSVTKREGFLKGGLSAGLFHDFFGLMEREFVKVDLSLSFPNHLPFRVTCLRRGVLLFVALR